MAQTQALYQQSLHALVGRIKGIEISIQNSFASQIQLANTDIQSLAQDVQNRDIEICKYHHFFCINSLSQFRATHTNQV